MTVRALPTLRFQNAEVQKAYDAIREAIQEGNGERGDPNNRWLTAGEATNGTLTKILRVVDSTSGNAALTHNGVFAQIQDAINSVLQDPFFQKLLAHVDFSTPPATLPDLMFAGVKALWKAVDAKVGLEGSDIEQITGTGYCLDDNGNLTGDTDQATCELNGHFWKGGHLALMATTMKAAQDGISSQITNLMSATPTLAAWWTSLKTTQDTHTSQITNLLSTTPTSATWWTDLTTQAAGSSALAGVRQLATTIYDSVTGLAAQYSLKVQVDAGGRTVVAGIGLAADTSGGSRVYILADKFAIASGDASAPVVPFVVTGGQVFINSAVIGEASIGSLQIAGNSVTTTASADWSPGTTINHTGSNSIQWYSPTLSMTFALTPQAVLLMAVVDAGAISGVSTNVGIQILRDGTPIASRTYTQVGGASTAYTMTFTDHPPSGNHLYQVAVFNSWTAGSWQLAYASLSAFASLR